MNTLNISDIERFFQFLDPNPAEIFTYAFFDINSKEVIKGHGVKFGILSEIVQECENFAGGGIQFTLHTNLNRTKLSGRKKKDIESVRVLCVDLDTATTPEQIKRLIIEYHVHMVVESSPGKYHLYWRIDQGTPLGTWTNFQLGLNHRLGGDINLAAINHTIRVPGVQRLTKEGLVFMPRIVFMAADCLTLSQNKVMELWPWILDDAEAARKVTKEEKRIIGKATKELISGNCGVSVEKAALASNRNDTLFSLIYNISAQSLGLASDVSEGITYPAALSIAQDFNKELAKHPKGQLDETEVEKTVLSAWESGTAKLAMRREKKEARLKELLGEAPAMEQQTTEPHVNGQIIGAVGTNSPIESFKYDYTDGALKVGRFTDQALTERILQRFKNYCVRTGKLVYAFDGTEKVWRSQKTTHELLNEYALAVCTDVIHDPEFVKELCMTNTKEGLVFSEAKFKKEQARFMSHFLRAQTVSAVLSDNRLPRFDISNFDRHTTLFYAANGVVDLLTGTIRDARPEDYLLKKARVSYDKDAKCPYFEQFLKEIYRDNDDPVEIIRFVQEMFGYSLTGSIDQQVIFVHAGDGANGKSRLLHALSMLMGDYASLLGAAALTKRKNAVEAEISRLGAKVEGKRVLIIDDLDTGTQWNDSFVKTLTADSIVSRNLYEEERDIPNRAKVHIGCNQTPVMEQSGHAMNRRVCILEYPRQFEINGEKMREIDANIARELPGILNWAREGLMRINTRSNGNILWPTEVKQRVEVYIEANQGFEMDLPSYFEAPESEEDKHSLDEIVTYLERCCSLEGRKLTLTKDRIGKFLHKNKFQQIMIGPEKTRKRVYAVKFSKETAPGINNL